MELYFRSTRRILKSEDLSLDTHNTHQHHRASLEMPHRCPCLQHRRKLNRTIHISDFSIDTNNTEALDSIRTTIVSPKSMSAIQKLTVIIPNQDLWCPCLQQHKSRAFKQKDQEQQQ